MINNPKLIQGQDEGTPLGPFHTLNAVGAGVTASLVAGVLILTIPGGGGGAATISAFTANCPYPTSDQLFNVVDASVTGISKILVTSGHYADTDENVPDEIYWNVESVAAGSFNFRIRAKDPQVVGGPFKFFYMLG